MMKRFMALAGLGYGLLPALGQTAGTPSYTDAGAPSATGVPVSLSAGAAEVVRLQQSGLAEDVISAYIQNAAAPFDLRADSIVYLKDLGITGTLITAMLNHDVTLRSQPAPTAALPAVPAPMTVVDPGVQPAPVYDNNPPPQVTYFYSDLSPFGAWIQLAGVGWCWQPGTVATDVGWRPYCQGGHWVWTDAGWYWQSDYAWGWAPFHYGRWLRHDRCGWVWVPDTVWGPAWVTWRVGADQCGWAPLPPRAEFDLALGFRFNGVRVSASFDFGLRPEVFTFIALGDFHQHDLGRRLLAPAEVVRVYNQTTVVNNYVVDHAMVNRGVAVERVVAATHQPFQKVVIRDLPAGTPRPADLRSTGQGETAVYRPHLSAPAHSAPLVAQRVDDRHPVVHHAAVAVPSPVAAGPRATPGHAEPALPQDRSPAGDSTATTHQPAPTVGSERPTAHTTVGHTAPAAVKPGQPTAYKPPTTSEHGPVAVQTAPSGPVTPRGVEVYHREPGPAFAPQTPPKTTAAPTQTSRQYVPKTTRQDAETRPAAPPAPKPANN